MKKIIIAILLISLVATQEFSEINTKIKSAIQNRKDENDKLRKLSGAEIGSLVVKEIMEILKSYLIGKLIDAIVSNLNEKRKSLQKSFRESKFTKLYKDSGKGCFISYIESDYVVSMYYHETKMHTATCDGGVMGGGVTSALGNPGEWAIAYCKAGIIRRKTYYNHF